MIFSSKIHEIRIDLNLKFFSFNEREFIRADKDKER